MIYAYDLRKIGHQHARCINTRGMEFSRIPPWSSRFGIERIGLYSFVSTKNPTEYHEKYFCWDIEKQKIKWKKKDGSLVYNKPWITSLTPKDQLLNRILDSKFLMEYQERFQYLYLRFPNLLKLTKGKFIHIHPILMH